MECIKSNVHLNENLRVREGEKEGGERENRERGREGQGKEQKLCKFCCWLAGFLSSQAWRSAMAGSDHRRVSQSFESEQLLSHSSASLAKLGIKRTNCSKR